MNSKAMKTYILTTAKDELSFGNDCSCELVRSRDQGLAWLRREGKVMFRGVFIYERSRTSAKISEAKVNLEMT